LPGKADQQELYYPVSHFTAVNFGAKTTRTSKKIKMIKRIITVFEVGLLALNRKPKKLISISSGSLLSRSEGFFLDIISAFLLLLFHYARRTRGKNILSFASLEGFVPTKSKFFVPTKVLHNKSFWINT
jgi:hypothetical protein